MATVEELKDGLLKAGDRIALKWRERISDVPTRYRLAWSVFRFHAFPNNDPASINAAGRMAIPGKGLTSVWLPDGSQFHYALIECLGADVTKAAAIRLLQQRS